MLQRLTFSLLCRLGAAVTAGLFGLLLTAPPVVFWLFGIEGGDSAAFLTRRAALLLLGIAVTLWLARAAPPSAGRRAIAVGTAVTMLGLAVLGAAEFARGVAGPGIWVAIGTEAALGLGFLSTLRADGARPV